MPSIIVGQGPPTEVSTGENGATFTNTGPATVSYSDSQNVRDVPEGTIAPTASVTLYGSVWLYASSRADVAYALLPSVGSGSAEDVEFTPAAGIAATDVQAAIVESVTDAAARWAATGIFDPRDYGAVYDGVTDDSTAINAAIDACTAVGGGIVEVRSVGGLNDSAKRVKITSDVVVEDGVWFRGLGATTTFIGAGSIRIPGSGVQLADRIQISDFTFQPSGSQSAIKLANGGGTGGLQLGWPRITVENVMVTDPAGFGFLIDTGVLIESRVINCVVMRGATSSFVVYGSDNFLIGCTAGGSSSGGGNAAFAIAGANSKLAACKAYGQLGTGFDVAGAGRHMLSACEAQDTAIGFDLPGSDCALAACVADTQLRVGFKIQGRDNAIQGNACWGGGGTGWVTPVGFLLAGSSGSMPLRNVINGASRCTVPVGGSVEGNTVSIRNGADAVQRPAYAATLTPDPFAGGTVSQTLTGNVAIAAPTNGGYVGQRLRFIFTQDATGTRTMTFATAYRTSWTPDTAGGKTNIIEFVFDGRYWQQTSATTGLTSVAAITDSFTRADDVVLGTATTGETWVAIRGGAQIVSNEARGGGTGFLNFADNVVTIDAATPDATISVKMVLGSNDGEGIAFRVVDTNNYWSVQNGYVVKKVAGVNTTMTTAGIVLAAGDILSVALSGPSIVVSKNGVPQVSTASADLITATKHGVYLVSTGGRLDDFSIT